MKLNKSYLLTTAYYALLTVGFIVRLIITVNGEPFWYDESFSIVVAKLPLDKLVEATAGDVHPPLYYILLHFWLMDKSTPVEIQARALSFLIGIVAWSAFNGVLGRLDLSEGEEMIASLLAMWLPGLTFFIVEARMYSLLAALVMGALVLLWETSSKNIFVEIARHVAAGALIGMACLTHNTGLLYAPIIALSALVYRVRRGDIPIRVLSSLMICAGVSLIIYAPWISPMLAQLQSTTTEGYWNQPPGLGTVAYSLYMALCYGLTASSVASVAMIIVAGITTVGLVMMYRHNPETLVMVVGVLSLMAIVSHVTGTGVMMHRAIMPLGYMFIVGWSRVISHQKAVMVPVGMICMVAAALFITDGRYDSKYDMWANLPSQPGDIIYANNSASTPLIIYTDLPIYVAYQDHAMAVGLSRKTLDAIGTPMRRLDEIEWKRAWFAWFDVPYTTDSERQYRREIIDRYGGTLYWSNSDPFFNSELWLLQNGAHTLD